MDTEHSLPHRQLRKSRPRASVSGADSLPHRQLRKQSARPTSGSANSLPHRQLRNVEAQAPDVQDLFTAAQAA